MSGTKVGLHVITEQVVKDLKYGLKTFGTYAFDDKGPQEVMELPLDELKALPAAEAAAVIIEISKQKGHGGRCFSVAEIIVQNLDDWDELFTIPGIEALYNGDEPDSIPVEIVRTDLGELIARLHNK